MADAKPKVLLVEDDPFMTTLLAEAFTKEEFELQIAANGVEAVKQFQDFRPDALLIDIILPQKSGLEALREIRALPGGANVPAIILSNVEEASYVSQAEQLNVKGYLIKANVQLPEIVAKVREALANQHQ